MTIEFRWTCDRCGKSETRSNYGSPRGWSRVGTRVNAHVVFRMRPAGAGTEQHDTAILDLVSMAPHARGDDGHDHRLAGHANRGVHACRMARTSPERADHGTSAGASECSSGPAKVVRNVKVTCLGANT